MTTSFWDNQQLKAQFPECATLKEIIVRLETDFSARGEVICEIRVNGMVLDEADEVRFATSTQDEIKDLSICSNRPIDLIIGALDSAIALLPDLEKASVKCSELLRGADIRAAQHSFKELVEGCQWLVETLMHVRGAASGIGQPIAHAERWLEAERLITKVVKDLTEAYTASDSVLVADLLEYEISGALAVWQEALTLERAKR
jgi:hypothetical protein